MIRYLVGHVIDVLKTLEPESVHCCVNSPPYWGLRRYEGQQEVVWGGDPDCQHDWTGQGTVSDVRCTEIVAGKSRTTDHFYGQPSRRFNGQHEKHFTDMSCQKCGAWRGALGLEPTPEAYVTHLVEVFREVRRVLRKDGTVWLNMGDCYASSPPGNKARGLKKWASSGLHGAVTSARYAETLDRSVGQKINTVCSDLKPKDLVGMPWRVALALQADGWWLRSDIIWSKPNPMPESVKDRPTRSHEYVFLLTKAKNYYYDQDAISEPVTGNTHPGRKDGKLSPRYQAAIPKEFNNRASWRESYRPSTRNKRSVWTIPSQPFPEAHFSTFPEALVEPCVKAGTSERGCCPKCGAPWERLTERKTVNRSNAAKAGTVIVGKGHVSSQVRSNHDVRNGPTPQIRTIGWQPNCDCFVREVPCETCKGTGISVEDRVELACPDCIGSGVWREAPKPIPCTVLDPFAGAGTTLLVARKLGRNAIGIDISEEYKKMALKRGELAVASLDKSGRTRSKRED